LKQFEIFIKNRPGELARVAEALAANGINIVAIASERTRKPMIKIVTNDEQSTQSALSNGKFKFEEHELIVLELSDSPGELVKIARKLANRGLNVESIHILGRQDEYTRIGIVVDNIEKAKDALRL